MPRASTSAHTLDSPGFRKSTPRRAAAQRASSNIASTSAQLLQTAIDLKGNGKARADEHDGDDRPRSTRKEGQARAKQERKRATDDKQEKPSKRRKVTDERPTSAPNAVGPTSRAAGALTQTATATEPQHHRARRKGRESKRKREAKRVRIAQTTGASSDGESSAYQPSHASDSDSDDAGGGGGARGIGLALTNASAVAAAATTGSDEIDWADPLSIPTMQPFRSRRYWQWLEFGIYTSALHDVASEKTHLGRALVEWELLRQHRAAEEEGMSEARRSAMEEDGLSRATSASGTPAGSMAATPDPEHQPSEEDEDATPRPTKRPRKRHPSYDPNRGLTPFPLTREASDRLEVDEDGVSLLPLPSAVALAKMARWPLHSSLVQQPNSSGMGHADPLEEALLAQYERVARSRHEETAPLPDPLRQAKAPSAYGPGGPFEHMQDGDLASDSDGSTSTSFEDNLANDDDQLLEPDSLPPSLAHIPRTIDSILLRLLDFVPKAPLPAYDYWMQRSRTEELLKDDRRHGFVRDECAPGWEEVLAIAKEMELPRHVLDKLEEQLIALFGPPSRSTTGRLPSPGLADKFVVRVQPRSNVEGSQLDEDETPAPTSPAPSSAIGMLDDDDSNDRSDRDSSAARISPSPAPPINPAASPAEAAPPGTASQPQPAAAAQKSGPSRTKGVRKKRVYKPYVYSEAQRARKAAYKRDLRQRAKAEREMASANIADEPAVDEGASAEVTE
ncbi:hypothetical protein JCM10908_001018 [Rhodotorula pacifica]|uniref:uncharacterized protein n=1 Tax=Rhodotorula pacifica TaxID=1495444 RepID=UPI0031827087